jgi:hypothetical protein
MKYDTERKTIVINTYVRRLSANDILLLKEIVERVLRITFPDKKKRKAKKGIYSLAICFLNKKRFEISSMLPA